eukprot:GHVP01025649.1.p5 GENE.GHVP01025649.1~~GHVP01025649.1.p5  ORF type:complete len:115 (-),score=31.02 GHVP01025649.1:4333-4677(-)
MSSEGGEGHTRKDTGGVVLHAREIRNSIYQGPNKEPKERLRTSQRKSTKKVEPASSKTNKKRKKVIHKSYAAEKLSDDESEEETEQGFLADEEMDELIKLLEEHLAQLQNSELK